VRLEGQLAGELAAFGILAAALVLARDLLVVADGDLRHVPLLDRLDEGGVGQILVLSLLVLDDVPEQDDRHENGHPEKEGLQSRVQRSATSWPSLMANRSLPVDWGVDSPERNGSGGPGIPGPPGEGPYPGRGRRPM